MNSLKHLTIAAQIHRLAEISEGPKSGELWKGKESPRSSSVGRALNVKAIPNQESGCKNN